MERKLINFSATLLINDRGLEIILSLPFDNILFFAKYVSIHDGIGI